ncbi:MAG: hypothetical protein E6G28_01955 [Actinobacteria bacterium]|nr:MAG: hypothetical protein E6G28_01955 [Actinomycetota bacterium]
MVAEAWVRGLAQGVCEVLDERGARLFAQSVIEQLDSDQRHRASFRSGREVTVGGVPTRIQHCGLLVGDLGRSPNFTFAGAWFRFGESEIHLLLERDTTGRAGGFDPGSSVAQGLATHLALEVDDLSVACARLEENGVAIAGGPMPRGDGVDQVFFRDPDGYVLELFEHTGEDQGDAPERAPVR